MSENLIYFWKGEKVSLNSFIGYKVMNFIDISYTSQHLFW